MKITKRQYEAEFEKISRDMDKAKDEYQAMLKADEEGETVDTDEFNAASDLIWQLSNDLKDLEDKWSMRNWTHQDYAFHYLVAQNID